MQTLTLTTVQIETILAALATVAPLGMSPPEYQLIEIITRKTGVELDARLMPSMLKNGIDAWAEGYDDCDTAAIVKQLHL